VAAWDVLAAFASVASDLPDDALVARITADCPALSPEAVTLTLAAALSPLPVRLSPTQVTPVAFTPTGEVAAYDVLQALVEALPSYARTNDLVARITADCPALSTEAVTLTLAAARVTGFAVSEHPASGWPDGSACEVATAGLLREAARSATWPLDREHPTRWLYRHHPAIVVGNPHGDYGHLKLSVDSEADLTRVREWLGAQREDK
jgi:spore coat polysaccharide biosynthesis protein SpsF (cytidylyltransferase family)